MRFFTFAAGLAVVGALSSDAVSQVPIATTSDQLRQQSIGFGMTSNSLRQQTFFGLGGSGNLQSIRNSTPSGGATTKPFANASRGPTVSPYLGLFNTGIIGDEIDNFQAFVRPQLEQQQFNQQVRQQANQINQQIQRQAQAAQQQAAVQEQRLNYQFQQFLSQPAFNIQGARDIMPTGHSTAFGYTGRFYPGRQ